MNRSGCLCGKNVSTPKVITGRTGNGIFMLQKFTGCKHCGTPMGKIEAVNQTFDPDRELKIQKAMEAEHARVRRIVEDHFPGKYTNKDTGESAS